MMTIMAKNSNGGEGRLNGEELIVRSNWKGYLKEFGMAVSIWEEFGGGFDDYKRMFDEKTDSGQYKVAKDGVWTPKKTSESTSASVWEVTGPKQLHGSSGLVPWTNFEAKYFECGEPVYEISFKLQK